MCCVCLYIYINRVVYIYIYIRVCLLYIVCFYKNILRVCLHMYLYIYIRVYCVFIYIYVCACVYICMCVCVCVCVGKYICLAISQMSRVFANGPGDQGSIAGRVRPKTQKIVLDSALLSTQHYKVRIKGKVEQSRELSSAPLHLGVVAIEKGAFGSPLTKVANFTTYIYLLCVYVYTYIYIYICVCVCIYIYICTYLSIT